MANNIEKQLKEISERLEQGVKEIFTSERYTEYLNTILSGKRLRKSLGISKRRYTSWKWKDQSKMQVLKI